MTFIMRLTKQCSDHLLAHLYEHIFFIHLDSLLRDNGFFPIIDYSIDAFTEDGNVTFDIEIYHTIDVSRMVADATTQFLDNEDFLYIGIGQIECEYGEQIIIDNIESVIKNLYILNKQGWDSEKIVDIASSGLTMGGGIDVKQLELRIEYPEIAPILKPLYRLIAGVTLDALESDIADTFSGFVASEAFQTDESKSLVGHIRLQELVVRHDVENLFNGTKQELIDKGGYMRLLSDLVDIESMELPPSNDQVYMETGVKMDNNAWATIATEENLQLTLELLELEIKQE